MPHVPICQSYTLSVNYGKKLIEKTISDYLIFYLRTHHMRYEIPFSQKCEEGELFTSTALYKLGFLREGF
ncbi:hypothetical protein LEP1GSC133_0166 [Leptospira borgpetersenii serovar Pomona str. 200901868]|uniref:Uncharacterized protein n=1 Tax=Leptospira borgpetersenii serovar Pomona str. 200901868 TaxID=1192866 RepID=M6VTT0_LEPBO|nr:hypothetical protein LEP1GSC133_0166 [Leptospira borgpetersenii serovar Pomona str. 200901868]